MNTTHNIPGWISNLQCDLLTTVIKELPDHYIILEIGAWMGRSTCAILDGTKPSHIVDICDRWSYASLFSLFVDLPMDSWPWKPFGNVELLEKEIKKLEDHKEPKKCWETFVYDHENSGRIRNVFHCDSLELTNFNYDCVILDGDHNYDIVYRELVLFKNSATICGDDYLNPDCPDITKAVDDFVLNYNKKLTLFPETLFFKITND
jgi:hypothetical protein